MNSFLGIFGAFVMLHSLLHTISTMLWMVGKHDLYIGSHPNVFLLGRVVWNCFTYWAAIQLLNNL